MCAPVIPLISAIGGLATAASSLGILGGNRRNMTQPQRAMTPAPSIQGPGPAASAVNTGVDSTPAGGVNTGT